MSPLTPSQRSALYTEGAAQWGIHAPLLAALAQVQGQPQLAHDSTGLGMTPAGSMPLAAVQDFPGQVYAAAQTLRHLLDYRAAWDSISADSNSNINNNSNNTNGDNLWDKQRGTYTEAFLKQVAEGYDPNRSPFPNPALRHPALPNTPQANPAPYSPAPYSPRQAGPPEPLESAPLAQLEPCNALSLIQAYDRACAQERQGWTLPDDFRGLDSQLQQICQRLPRFYRDLNFQREAILNAAQVWFGLPDRAQVLAQWHHPTPLELPAVLFRFLQEVVTTGGDRPHFSPPQREALLLLIQRWHQWPSRQATLHALYSQDLPATPLHTLDPALLAFAQRIPHSYRRSGSQREALTDCFQIWQGYHTRVDSLIALGLNPQVFIGATLPSTALQQATLQVDRALIRFIRHIPHHYHGHDRQRQALLALVQRWEAIETQVQTIDFLIETVKTLATLPPHRPESLPAPPTLAPSPAPALWTPHNLDLQAPIIPDSPLTWAEATAGGLYWPPSTATLTAITGLAEQLQGAIDRLGRPLRVVRWYRPEINPPAQATQAQPALGQGLSSQGLSSQDPPGQGLSSQGLSSQDSPAPTELDRHTLGDAVLVYVTGLQGSQLYSFLDPWWPGGLGWSQAFPLLLYLDHRGYRVRWSGTFQPSSS